MNYFKLLRTTIIISLYLIFSAGCGNSITPSETATPTPFTLMANLNLPTATPIPPPSDGVYIGIVQGNNVIFVTHDKEREIYKQYFLSYEYIGKIYCGGFDFNFNDLINPQLLFSLNNIDQVNVICGDGKVYISGIKQESESVVISFVAVVNPEVGDYYVVWTGMPGYVEEIWNDVIVIKLLPCYFCSPSPLRETVIVNANTGNKIELGEVGDVRILNDSVAYRILAPLEVPCDPGEGCDGSYTDYKPTGEILYKPLP